MSGGDMGDEKAIKFIEAYYREVRAAVLREAANIVRNIDVGLSLAKRGVIVDAILNAVDL